MTKETYSIKPSEIEKLTADEIKRLYLLDCELTEKYGFLKRYRTVDEFKKSFLSTFETKDNQLFVVFHKAKLCGLMTFVKSTDWGGNEQYKLTVKLCVTTIDPELTASIQGFIDGLFTNFNQIAVVSYNQELDGLLEGYASEVQLNAKSYLLAKEDINLEMLRETIKVCQVKNDDLRMVYTDVIREEYIKQYCDLFMETMKDMPDNQEAGHVPYVITPDDQRKSNERDVERNGHHHCYMVFDGDVMVAKTNVSVNNEDPRFPYQFMIGVLKGYRGRSLGKWMYASMYKKLSEEVEFKKILVHHHPKNKHAIAISEWIGYELGYLEMTHLVNKL